MSMDRHSTLLLVEDEHLLRGLVAAFLRRARFDVMEAADGPEGVARFEADGPFDLLLVDLYLPGFSGLEVCRRVRRRRPEQPILVASAVVAPEVHDGLEALGLSEVVTKPYLPEVLLNQVRRLTAHARSPRIIPGPHALAAAEQLPGRPAR